MKTGIYQIVNVTNGKSYIGSCASPRDGISGRWTRHKRDLIKNRHHSPKLQRSWNKHGADMFKFKVLLYCDPQNCITYEQIAIDHFKPDYNISKIAGSCLGVKRSERTKRLMRSIRVGSLNPMYGKTHTKQIKHTIGKLSSEELEQVRHALSSGLSQRSIAKMFAVNQATISRINTNQIWH